MPRRRRKIQGLILIHLSGDGRKDTCPFGVKLAHGSYFNTTPQ